MRHHHGMRIGRAQDAGIAPNAVAYHSAIRACATQKLWPVALSLLDDLRADGLALSTISYNAALAACERGGQWEEARLLLEEMCAEETGTGRPLADAISYNTAIAACRKGGSVGAARFALSLLRGMHERRLAPNVIAYTGAMTACVEAGRWRAALSLFSRLRANATVAQPDGVSYDVALLACAGGGRWEDALQLLGAMRATRHCQPRAASYVYAADACAVAGQKDLEARLRTRAQRMHGAGRRVRPPQALQGGRAGRSGARGRGRGGRGRGRGRGRGERTASAAERRGSLF